MNVQVERYNSGKYHHVTVAHVTGVAPRDILALKTACVNFVRNGTASEVSREIDRAEGETIAVFRGDSGVAQLRFSSDEDNAQVLTIDHDSLPRELKIPLES